MRQSWRRLLASVAIPYDPLLSTSRALGVRLRWGSVSLPVLWSQMEPALGSRLRALTRSKGDVKTGCQYDVMDASNPGDRYGRGPVVQTSTNSSHDNQPQLRCAGAEHHRKAGTVVISFPLDRGERRHQHHGIRRTPQKGNQSHRGGAREHPRRQRINAVQSFWQLSLP